MPAPFWDVLHPDIVRQREVAGALDPGDPPGYEENQAANVNPWDLLVLNHTLVPGVASVKVVPKFLIDVKKASNKDGGLTVDRGHEAARIDIQITIWTPRQWEALQFLLEKTLRRAGGKLLARVGKSGQIISEADSKAIEVAPAIPITHPACTMFGITAVVFESAESPEPAPEVGARIVRLRAIQYIPPVKRPVTKKVEGQGLKNTTGLQDIRDTVFPPKTPAQTQATARPRVEPAGGGNGLP